MASIGTIGDSFALAETVVGLYKTECAHRDGPFRGVDDLELATASWVHWFNTAKAAQHARYVTPVEYEAAYHTASRDTEAA